MGKANTYPTATIVTGEEKLTGLTSGSENEYKQFPIPLLAEQIQVEALDLGITTHNTLSLIDADARLDTEKGILLGNNGGWNVDPNITLTIKSKLNVFENKQIFFGDGDVRFETGSVEKINVAWFGATPDSGVSAVDAIRKAIDTAINSSGNSIVYFPEGKYLIDAPIYPRYYDNGGTLQFYNLTLEGAQPVYSKQEGKGGITWLDVPNKIPFVFGIQGARGVTIKNIAMTGYITEPTKEHLIEMTEEELLIEYTDEVALRQYAPLCAIAIDPLMDNGGSNFTGSYNDVDLVYDNGLSSTRILIEGCHVSQFPVAVAFSPNGTTQQGDSVRITNCHFKDGVVGILTCQNQSRTLIVDNVDISRYKWAFAGDLYGALTGIIPEISNVKVSDGCAWIFRCNGTQSYVNISHLYAEGLYGIGYSASNWHPVGINNSTIKLQDKLDSAKKGFINPCILYTDNATISTCTISVGGAATIKEPLVMSVDRLILEGNYLDTPIINIGSNVNAKFGSIDTLNKYRDSKLPPETTWDITKMNGQTTETIVYNGEVLDPIGAPLLFGDGLTRSSYTIPVADTSFYTATQVVAGVVTVDGDFVFARVEDMPYPIESVNTNTAIGQIIFGGIVLNTSVTIFSNVLPKANIDLRVITLSDVVGTAIDAEQEIDSWNLQSTVTKSQNHGLSATEWLTVRIHSVTIFNDVGVVPRIGIGLEKDGFWEINDTSFDLTRGTTYFDPTEQGNWNDSGTIRGHIKFSYVPD